MISARLSAVGLVAFAVTLGVVMAWGAPNNRLIEESELLQMQVALPVKGGRASPSIMLGKERTSLDWSSRNTRLTWPQTIHYIVSLIGEMFRAARYLKDSNTLESAKQNLANFKSPMSLIDIQLDVVKEALPSALTGVWEVASSRFKSAIYLLSVHANQPGTTLASYKQLGSYLVSQLNRTAFSQASNALLAFISEGAKKKWGDWIRALQRYLTA